MLACRALPGVLLVAALLQACTETTPVSSPPPPVATDASRERALRLVERERLGFRERAGTLTSHQPACDVEVTPAGARLVPARGRPVLVETRSVARGLADSWQGPTRLDAEGRPTRARTFAREVLTPVPGGFEQAWRFHARPPGTGPLLVRVGFDGAAEAVGDGERGVRLSLGGGAVLRYGHGTFIDASGRRTRVPVRATGAGVELSLSGAAVDAAVYPAVLDPSVTVELEASPPATGVAPPWQDEPSVAINEGKDEALVVWTDWRHGSADSDVFGAVVSLSTGRVTSRFPVAVSSHAELSPLALLASATGSYGAAWLDDRGL